MSSALSVPEGYKMTEVGVIPGDWESLSLGNVAKFQRGFDLPSRLRKNGEIPIITSSGYGEFHSESRVNGPGLVTGRYGTIGEVFYVKENFWPLNTTLFVKNFFGNDILFVSYLLRTIDFHSHSGKSGVPGVNRNDLHEIAVALPAKVEQQAIAEALSDADALVESLEQLLTKKRQIKQGAMQELLTGQKRLPGFGGDWKTWRFGEIASPGRDRIDPKFGQQSNFCIELEHIGQGTGSLLGHTETTDESSLKSVFRDGDVLFGKLRAYLKKYWLATCSGVCSTEIWVLKSNESRVLPGFLFQMVSTESFIEAASMAYGTHMPRSDWSAVKNFEVQLPSIEEQTAIVAILSTLDSDIAALQSQLVKARQIKQGMAQELLTGRIRLVSPAITQGVPA